MAQIGLVDVFRRKVLVWDDAVVTMKDPGNLMGITN